MSTFKVPATSTALAIFALLAGGAAAARAETPEQDFELLYGPQVRTVEATPDKRDDVELGKKLLADARRTPDDRKFQAVICAKAYDLAVKLPEGYPAALDALDLLATADPARRAEADDKGIQVRAQDFAAAQGDRRRAAAEAFLAACVRVGDAHVAADRVPAAVDAYQKGAPAAVVLGPDRVAVLQAKVAVARKLEDLRGRAARSGEEKATAQLIELLLVELGRPADAAAAANGARLAPADADLARVAKLAAKDVADVADDEAMTLGDWYAARAPAASVVGRPLALACAKAYYDRFAAAHPKADGDRLRAARASEQIGTTLASSPAPPPPAAVASVGPRPDLPPAGPGPAVNPRPDARDGPATGQPLDLLRIVDLDHDVVAGTWRKVPDGIACDAGVGARVRLPCRPSGEYDFKVEYTRQQGERALYQVLSFGGRDFSWLFAASRATTCGFALVGGKNFYENPTTVVRADPFKNGRRYVVVVRVRKASVTALIDGAVVSRHQTNYADLSMDAQGAIGGGQLGIGAAQSKVTFHVAEMTPVDPAPAAVAAAAAVPPGGPGAGRPLFDDAPSGTRTVDLLALVDPAKDAVHGRWARHGPAIVSLEDRKARIEFPYVPPAEFDFRVTFAVGKVAPMPSGTRGWDGVRLVSPGAGGVGQFAWVLGAFDNRVSYLEQFDRKRAGEQSRGRWLEDGRRCAAVLRVRKGSVEARLNGALVSRVETDFANANVWSGDKLSRTDTLGLATWGDAATFEAVDLVEVTGRGRPLRVGPAGPAPR